MSRSDTQLLVYLDSSDFSVMSDPKRSWEWEAERLALERHVAQGDIRCVFSLAHLVEMAPSERSRTHLAVAKADLLVSLCGSFALPSIDKLLSAELRSLRDGMPWNRKVVLANGDWFPALDDLIPAGEGVTFTEESVRNAIAEVGGNRATRRAAQKRLLKKGGLAPAVLRQLRTEAPGEEHVEIQKTFPMRDEDARVLARYVRGQASREAAQQAFESSLRDPSNMMRWFASESVDPTKFTSWLRDSAVSVKASVEAFSALAREIREMPPEIRCQPALQTIFAKDDWDRHPDRVAGRFVQQLAEAFLPPMPDPIPFERLHETCAGLSTMLKTFFDAAWASTSEQPRAPLASDLGDCFHAIYAPYVDLFRPDSFMAQHVTRHAARFGTRVVPKLKQLLPAIEQRLGDRRVPAQ
jgi:hypothetical protein